MNELSQQWKIELNKQSRPRTADFTWGKLGGRRMAAVREQRRAAVRPGLARARSAGRGVAAGAAPGTLHTGDGTGGSVECGVVYRWRGELRPAAVVAVGGRRRAVLGVEGRRGVGGGRGHQRRRRAGEAEKLGSGRRRRGGKGDRGGKYRSPLQGDFCRPPLQADLGRAGICRCSVQLLLQQVIHPTRYIYPTRNRSKLQSLSLFLPVILLAPFRESQAEKAQEKQPREAGS
jgi:hypothetical protein